MFLVDTSVWIDHLREKDPALSRALEGRQVLGHPWVMGEIALGFLKNRAAVLTALQGLPQAVLARHDELMALLATEKLHGKGLGYVDLALLASARLTPQARLWTRDKRLAQAGQELGIAGTPI